MYGPRDFRRKLLAAETNQIMGSGGPQALLDGSSVFVPLTHTAIPTRGSIVPSFTRATTATFRDWEGVLRTVPSGCARFEGARMVYNQLPSSEDLTVGFTATGSTLAAGSITESGATSNHYAQTTSMVIPTNAVFVMRAEIKQSVGTRNIGIGTNSVGNAIFNPSTGVFVANDGVTLDHETGTQTADGYWPVWVKVKATTSNKPIISLYAGTTQSYAGDGASQVLIRKYQLEDVTGQADQTASEYVSVGVPTDRAGDELVTNGTFDTATTGWAARNTATLSVVSGRLRITNGTFGGAEQAVSTVPGTKYVLARNFTAGTTTACITQIGTTNGNNDIYAGGIVSDAYLAVEFTAVGATTYIQFFLGDGVASNYADFDNISVKPAIYHGAGVDGVEFFNTDRDGAVISAATNKGYLAEGARTNLCLQSNAFTTTWLTTGAPSPTQNAVGLDGGTTGWTMTDASGVDASVYQGVTLTAAAWTASVFIKKTTGVQAAYPVLIFYPSDTTQVQAATVDTTNGVVTDWTSFTASTMAAGRSVRISSYNDDYWRVELTKTGTVALHYFQLLPAGSTTATYAGPTISTAAQGSAVFYGAQVELGSSASSYIATTTAAVTRAADVLTYPSAGNFSDTAGTMYAEVTYDVWANAVGSIVGSATQGMLPTVNGTKGYDGTNTVTDLNYSPSGTIRMAVSWDGSTMTVAAEGADTVSGAYDGAWNLSSIGIGLGSFSTIRNVRIWNRALSDTELISITSAVNSSDLLMESGYNLLLEDGTSTLLKG